MTRGESEKGLPGTVPGSRRESGAAIEAWVRVLLALCVRVVFALCIPLAAIGTGIGCASDAKDSGTPPAADLPKATGSAYSVKVWIERDGKQTLREFVPVDSRGPNPTDLASAGKGEPSAMVQPGNLLPLANATVVGEDGGVVHEGDMTEEELAEGKQPGWGLLRAALSQCSRDLGSWQAYYPEFPWVNGRWYFFDAYPEWACDTQLKCDDPQDLAA